MSLEKVAPTSDVLLALERDELGLRLLPGIDAAEAATRQTIRIEQPIGIFVSQISAILPWSQYQHVIVVVGAIRACIYEAQMHTLRAMVFLSFAFASSISLADNSHTDRKVLNTYVGPVTCHYPGGQYVIKPDNGKTVEFFYYSSDPRRIWVRAGWTWILGSDTSCQIEGLETAHP